jgi:hypothetical protein
MKQQLLRTVSTCALVVAMGGAAFAQTGGAGGGGSQPQTQERQERMPDAGSGSSGRDAAPPSQGRSGGETVQPKGGATETPSRRQPGSAQRDEDRAAPRKQDRTDTRDEQKRSPRASGESKDDGKRATDRGGKEQDRARTGQEQRGQDKDRARTGQDRGERGDRAPSGRAERERGKDADRQRQGAREGRGGATQLSEQQRTTVRERFTRAGVQRNRETNVNFDIRVGASVPRSVTLHALPADVIEVVPAYRNYRYVYVRDEIVIVDPGSYEVVAVVTTGGGSRAAGVRGRSLTLAPPDRAFVRQHIDRSASIRLGIGGLTVGMALPQGVALLPMPEVVVERYPDLRDYRYFVYEDDIAVVDPSTDEIVMILND